MNLSTLFQLSLLLLLTYSSSVNSMGTMAKKLSESQERTEYSLPTTPVIEYDDCEEEENSKLNLIHSTAAFQGNVRRSMEDYYFPNENQHQPSLIADEQNLYGIFDGHGGKQAANFAMLRLWHDHSINLEVFNKQDSLKNQDLLVKKALTKAFEATDKNFTTAFPKDTSGSTAVTALFIKDQLYVANIGDSEAVISFEDEKYAQCLSTKHNPGTPTEQERLKALGFTPTHAGTLEDDKIISFNNDNGKPLVETFKREIYRICGCSVSRAFGDNYTYNNFIKHKAKDSIISTPDISSTKIEKNGFLILASDGLWDVMSYQAATDFVWYNLKQASITSLKNISQEVLQTITSDLCKFPMHHAPTSHDNTSVNIIVFTQKS